MSRFQFLRERGTNKPLLVLLILAASVVTVGVIVAVIVGAAAVFHPPAGVPVRSHTPAMPGGGVGSAPAGGGHTLAAAPPTRPTPVPLVDLGHGWGVGPEDTSGVGYRTAMSFSDAGQMVSTKPSGFLDSNGHDLFPAGWRIQLFVVSMASNVGPQDADANVAGLDFSASSFEGEKTVAAVAPEGVAAVSKKWGIPAGFTGWEKTVPTTKLPYSDNGSGAQKFAYALYVPAGATGLTVRATTAGNQRFQFTVTLPAPTVGAGD